MWGLPQFRMFLDGGKPASSAVVSDTPPSWFEQSNVLAGKTDLRFQVPHLHEQVQPDAKVIGGDGKPKAAEFRLNWLSATGTGILVATILSAFWMRVSPRRY